MAQTTKTFPFLFFSAEKNLLNKPIIKPLLFVRLNGMFGISLFFSGGWSLPEYLQAFSRLGAFYLQAAATRMACAQLFRRSATPRLNMRTCVSKRLSALLPAKMERRCSRLGLLRGAWEWGVGSRGTRPTIPAAFWGAFVRAAVDAPTFMTFMAGVIIMLCGRR